MLGQLKSIVSVGVSNVMTGTRTLWPGHCNQLLECSLSFYVGAELAKAGFAVIQEFPTDSKNRIDLVAFEAASKTVVLLESKRFWENHGTGDPRACLEDIARIETVAQQGLSVWCFDSKTVKPLSVQHAFGVALGSASGLDRAATAVSISKARSGLGPVSKEFETAEHEDGTYAVLHRVWELKVKGQVT